MEIMTALILFAVALFVLILLNVFSDIYRKVDKLKDDYNSLEYVLMKIQKKNALSKRVNDFRELQQLSNKYNQAKELIEEIKKHIKFGYQDTNLFYEIYENGRYTNSHFSIDNQTGIVNYKNPYHDKDTPPFELTPESIIDNDISPFILKSILSAVRDDRRA